MMSVFPRLLNNQIRSDFMQTIKNCYFKDFGDGSGFISGLPLPAINKILQDIHFVDCRFNVSWEEFTVINCTFENCDGQLPNEA
jgi:hypothetical protein